MSKATKHIYKFGPFCFDTNKHVLMRNSESVRLTSKSFETLLILVENSGQVVERSELVERVWPNTFVEEANLTQQIFTLRKALGTDQHGRQYIETVPKLGYRFAATVSKVPDDDINEEQQTRARLIAQDSITRMIGPAAVSPSLNVSNSTDTDCPGDGIIEGAVNNFSQLPRLRVVALSTVFRYRGRDPQKTGREINIHAVVKGRIIKLEDGLVFMLELVDATDGS